MPLSPTELGFALACPGCNEGTMGDIREETPHIIVCRGCKTAYKIIPPYPRAGELLNITAITNTLDLLPPQTMSEAPDEEEPGYDPFFYQQ